MRRWPLANTMRFTTPVQRKHVRIEIIPLIDIMFFLLASFMLVSLNMTKIENIAVAVPSAVQVTREFPPDMIHVAVDKAGDVYVGKQLTTLPDLYMVLTNRYKVNKLVPVYIAGDAETHHGDMVKILEFVRRAGIQSVHFTVNSEPTPGASQPGS